MPDSEFKKPAGPYFAASQPAARFHVRYTDWDLGLRHSLLLLKELHVADSGIIGHPYVLHHRGRSTGMSWLERGLRDGLVVLRARAGTEFEKLGHELKEFPAFHPQAEEVGRWLASMGSSLQVRPWGDPTVADQRPFGVSYQERLVRTFSGDLDRDKTWQSLSDFEVGKELADFWHDRKDWRIDWPQLALERTESVGQRGLRVSDLLWVAQNELIKKSLMKGELLDHVDPLRLLERVVDEKTRRHLRLYLKIVTEEYDNNFSTRIACQNESVNIDYETATVTLREEADPEGDGQVNELGSAPWPSNERLLTLDNVDLAVLRQLGDNTGYFKALGAWQASQTLDDARFCHDRLREYGDLVCKRVDEKNPSKLHVFRHPPTRAALTVLATGLGAYAGNSLGAPLSQWLESIAGDAIPFATIVPARVEAVVGGALTYMVTHKRKPDRELGVRLISRTPS